MRRKLVFDQQAVSPFGYGKLEPSLVSAPLLILNRLHGTSYRIICSLLPTQLASYDGLELNYLLLPANFIKIVLIVSRFLVLVWFKESDREHLIYTL